MNSPSPSLLRGTIIVSALTQLSRLFGFVREMLCAPLLGTGFFSDAYFVAFRIPNLLRSFVAEGAMTSAFVPLFSGELEKSKEDAERALRSIASFLMGLTLALSILGIISASSIVQFFAPGFDAEKIAYTTMLTRVMLPYIILVSFISLLNGALNSVHIFGSAALAQVLMNVMLIGGALAAFFFPQAQAGLWLAWSVLAGGLLGVISQLPSLHRAGFRLRLGASPFTPAVGQLLALMLPALFGAAVYQLNIFIATMLASLLREGSVSWIYYADRLAQFPIGVFTVALGSVLLPTLSRAHARHDHATFTEQLLDSLRYTSFLIIPVSFVLYYFAEPFFTLVLEHGKFTHDSSLRCAETLQAFCFGLWAVSCHSIAIKAFLARKDTVTPTLLGMLSLASSVLFSLLLMGPPQSPHAGDSGAMVAQAQSFLAQILPLAAFGHVGLALSSSLASYISFLTLAILLSLRLPQLPWRRFIVSTAKSAAAVALCAGCLHFFGIRSLKPIPFVLLGLPLTGIIFLLAGKCLRCDEIEAAQQLGKRLVAKMGWGK